MGNSLDKPRTDKQTEESEGNGLKYGLSSMQGYRMKMEDRHCTQIGLEQYKDWSFFAVFDGHAGSQVATHSAEHLLQTIIQKDQFRQIASSGEDISEQQIDSIIQSIKNGFLELDEKMKSLPHLESGEDRSGTTAICALISNTHIFIVNLGDSRAILCRSGAVHFASQDHKPNNPEEKQRILNAGGDVIIERVNGSLAVSRALGDYDYKQSAGKQSYEQLVSPMPEVTVIKKESTDEFLVLACDGVWDVMSNEELNGFIRYQLSIEKSLGKVCSNTIDTCLHKNSKDNLSVILLTFSAAPTTSAEAQTLDEELNQKIVSKAEEILNKNKEFDLQDLKEELLNQEWNDLPPGGGLESKMQIIEDMFNSFNQKNNNDFESNNKTNRNEN